MAQKAGILMGMLYVIITHINHTPPPHSHPPLVNTHSTLAAGSSMHTGSEWDSLKSKKAENTRLAVLMTCSKCVCVCICKHSWNVWMWPFILYGICPHFLLLQQEERNNILRWYFWAYIMRTPFYAYILVCIVLEHIFITNQINNNQIYNQQMMYILYRIFFLLVIIIINTYWSTCRYRHRHK